MEALSQLDIAHPDHVSVITRDGRVTISVVNNDGTSVTLGFPIFNTARQQGTKSMGIKIQETTTGQPRPKPVVASDSTQKQYIKGTPKLTVSDVKEIKMMVHDPGIIGQFVHQTEAYREIGKAYNVTGATIGNIARGISWREIRV